MDWFIVTNAQRVTNFSDKQLWPCSGENITVFATRKDACNAIKTTIQRRRKAGFLDTWSMWPCYRTHKLELANEEVQP